MKTTNPRVHFDYTLIEKYEAGLVLTGPEVKSVKTGHLSLKEAHVRVINNEAWLVNAYIAPYNPSADDQYDPYRTRKLLLHQAEILHLSQKSQEKGLTIVPVSCYTMRHNLKLEIALAKGKRAYKKRELLKKRDLEREVGRRLK
jgi:SsrA-binding protein